MYLGVIVENFHLIEFDASSPETFTINGKQYKSLGQGQPNELAMELFQKQFSFPALFFLDENFQPITQISGYTNPKFLEQVLKYIQTDKYKNQKFEDFVKNYKSEIN
jgi:thioredoxin-related protein